LAQGNPTSMIELQQQRWEALIAHINKWFFEPDIEAFALALAVAKSHSFTGEGEKPVWLFVIGPPGTGKTALVIEALSAFSKTTIMSKISDKAFLSGFRPGGRAPKGKNSQNQPKSYSFLDRIGNSQILLFKDFTTLLTERPEVQATVMAQLRELWDGRLKREVGSLTEDLDWKGKLTIVAACTPALEHHWAASRALGERFMQVRLRTPEASRVQMAQLSERQRGHVAHINEELHRLVKAFISITRGAPPLKEMPEDMLYLADLVARVRVTVQRSHGKVVDVAEPEAPTRIAAAMGQVAQAHASLFYRNIEPADLKIARRMAIDTIPSRKWKLLELMPETGDISSAELAATSKIHPDILRVVMADLEAIGAVQRQATDSEMMEGTWWEFTEEFRELRRRAGLAPQSLASPAPSGI
jgi:hypothetical protein